MSLVLVRSENILDSSRVRFYDIPLASREYQPQGHTAQFALLLTEFIYFIYKLFWERYTFASKQTDLYKRNK